MAGKSDPPKAKTSAIHKSKIFWIIFVSSGLILYFGACSPQSCSCGGGSGAGSSQRTTTQQPVPEKKVEKKFVVKEYQLDPCRWTDWISLARLKPPEVPNDAHFQFQINAPGWHEIWFIGGRKVRMEKNSTDSLGDLCESTFKLRGEGTAVVRIEYIYETRK